jgi:hypothetical protein
MTSSESADTETHFGCRKISSNTTKCSSDAAQYCVIVPTHLEKGEGRMETGWRERQRVRERDREGERDRQRGRETDREGERKSEMEKETDREGERERQGGRKRQTGREKETDREGERERTSDR